MLTDYFETNYLVSWRKFISTINMSNPFKEAWDDVCKSKFLKTVKLQQDSPTRWSSTVAMLKKAVKVQDAVNMMVGVAPLDQRVFILFPDFSIHIYFFTCVFFEFTIFTYLLAPCSILGQSRLGFFGKLVTTHVSHDHCDQAFSSTQGFGRVFL